MKALKAPIILLIILLFAVIFLVGSVTDVFVGEGNYYGRVQSSEGSQWLDTVIRFEPVEGGRQVFITGHSEYDARTLEKEYLRDKNAGLPISVPENYYPNDDDTLPPRVTWRSHANLLFSNWLNYFVYQNTPYDLDDLSKA